LTVFIQTPIYFVTTCSNKRRPISAAQSVHSAFVEFARDGPGRGAWVGAYVLMPDHLHVFVGFDDQKVQLTAWMKSLKNALSKTLRAVRVVGRHWQKGFFDHVLRSEESYEEKWKYVRENPVRAAL
jgi:putative transposase